MANHETTTSRRAVLAGAATALATGAAVNVAAIVATRAATPDPIFAAIERHRQLYAAHGVACETDDEDAANAACDAAFSALAELVALTPTTLAGCAAMLRYVQHVTDADNTGSEGQLFAGYARVEPAAADLLLRLADRIETVQS